MKITPRKLNRKLLRAKTPKAIGATMALLALVVSGVVVFAANKNSGYSGGAGDGGNSQNKCKSGNCKSVRKNGAYWLLVPAASDSINPASIFGLVEKKGNITGCKSGGGYFYVLVTQLSGGGLAGPISIDTVPSNGRKDSGPNNISGARNVSWAQAQTAFNKNADFYATQGQRWSGTNLAWFCADAKNANAGEETILPEEDTPDQEPPRAPYKSRQYGATFSRIAVEDMSIDGVTPSTRQQWRAGVRRGPYSDYAIYARQSLYTDSGPQLTDYGADVETIAKPGDSVHFLHEVYMGNRLVRMATDAWTQDQWTYRRYGYENEIPDYMRPYQTFNIIGQFDDSENYSFTFPVGINNIGHVNWLSQQSASGYSWSYFQPFSHWPIGSVEATDDYLGVGVISPASLNANYDCSLYTTLNPFIIGGFQIPGYKSSSYSSSCSSGSYVGTTNLVGHTFGQQHRVTNVKAWEAYHHQTSGYCGCNYDTYNYNHYYYYTNHDRYGNEYTSGPYTEWHSSYGDTGRNAQLDWNMDETSYYTGYVNGQRAEYRCKSEPVGECNVVETKDHEHHYEYRDHQVPYDDCTYEISGYVCVTRYKTEVINEEYTSHDREYDSVSKTYELTDNSKDDSPTGFRYKTRISTEGDIVKTARVYTPYNFLTSVSSDISGSILFQGGSVESSFRWSIDPRDNRYTSTFPYATMTPDNTEVRIIEFMYQPGARDASGASYQSLDPCSFYNNKGAVGCQVLRSEVKSYNELGLYDGQKYSTTANRIIPDDDEYVGYKYCVAIGINYTSSHSWYNDDSYSSQKAAMNPSTNWNISNASCRPIAKKPNFQIWNGSIYTHGQVNTSISQKAVGTKSGDFSKTATTLFGSWTDYMIIAKQGVYGMSSGAMLGYNNYGYSLNLIGGQPYTSMKDLSPETISNNDNNSIGFSNVDASVSINNTLNRLKTRYKEKAEQFSTDSNDTRVRTAETGMQYVVYNGDLKVSDISVVNNLDSDHPNRTTRSYNGAIYKGLGDGTNDNTLVIYVSGTLTIDRNICLSENGSTCSYSDATKLITYNDISTNASSKLPQILIFAQNIKITGDVTRVDAWLIADRGTINTCQEFNLNSYDGTRAFRNYGSYYGNYDGISTANGGQSKCYKTLVVNGPIFAAYLELRRTAGNYHGGGEMDSYNVLYRSIGSDGSGNDPKKGSISPAEIFNLRADAYIWAYNQAERYSEAVVTYTRELAPRY